LIDASLPDNYAMDKCLQSVVDWFCILRYLSDKVRKTKVKKPGRFRQLNAFIFNTITVNGLIC